VSRENVKVVRGIYEAFARRDIAAIVAVADPEIRCYDRPDRPGATVYAGHEGLIRFTQSDWEVFENVRYEPADFIDRGDQVVVRIRQAGRGKASGATVEEEIANVWTLRGGKCVEMRVYSSQREALEAVESAE
jgi:ketosteroid isomerase-like protein